ncbi:hypothetical protein [Streptomyces sp. NPDC052036]|uniref:hypothetical protein n=1 Tax=Streptomyces sp. NPDC052036 TaxID=3155171 RepID=UPI00341749D2
MDDSDTRRGRPTIHRVLAGNRGDGRTERFGLGAAVLAGDLAFTCHDPTLALAALASRWRLRPVPGAVVKPRAEMSRTPGPLPMVPEPR